MNINKLLADLSDNGCLVKSKNNRTDISFPSDNNPTIRSNDSTIQSPTLWTMKRSQFGYIVKTIHIQNCDFNLFLVYLSFSFCGASCVFFFSCVYVYVFSFSCVYVYLFSSSCVFFYKVLCV